MGRTQSVLLIDADILIYRHAFKGSTSITWDTPETMSTIEDFDYARFTLDSFVADCLAQTKTGHPIMCMSVPTQEQHRYAMYPEYKANRKNLVRPALFGRLKQHLIDNYETRIKPGLEADDVLGILMSSNYNRYIMMSADKDLRQIYGLHYDAKKRRVVRVTKKQANRWFYIQILKGDSTDNIPGCPRIGDVKATRIIDSVIDYPESVVWNTIVDVYENAGLDEEYALLQARLVRILRSTDYDHIKKEVIPWLPMKT